ncbi:Piso0_003859 [Millerozyma farinosa CBS 7064]|uniref:Piso0_003859 protein n=1 Tax=Pichia sorbitophila (strain ATCC MYA-4447 / BCRC 22081 / CBS 7064 / NBRC 10061 / NRRL Y-12695) TaxID=559304 RepID=G8Y6T7_PICSO|nr:Piso0_003859 [Millerozyma farinosa CBS 7064]CCE84317.1 Piso0_003859 [Millerozyma farinosa CBS 7064]
MRAAAQIIEPSGPPRISQQDRTRAVFVRETAFTRTDAKSRSNYGSAQTNNRNSRSQCRRMEDSRVSLAASHYFVRYRGVPWARAFATDYEHCARTVVGAASPCKLERICVGRFAS